MTKISTVEETLDEVEKYWDTDRTEATRAIMRYASGQRAAILTELRDGGLLKTKPEIVNMLQDDKVFIIHGMDGVKCHNTLAKAIKAHINNLINPSV